MSADLGYAHTHTHLDRLTLSHSHTQGAPIACTHTLTYIYTLGAVEPKGSVPGGELL